MNRGLPAGWCLVLATCISGGLNPMPASSAAVARIGGADRYATAALVADRVLASESSHTAILVTGSNFPDELVAGTWPDESVVLLTRPQSLPWETFAMLLRPEINDVVIVAPCHGCRMVVYVETVG